MIRNWLVQVVFGNLMLFVALAKPVLAQDISWQMDKIKPGFAVRLQYDPGGIYTHRLRGKDGPLFVLDSYFADETAPLFTVWVNESGNYVGLRTRDGRAISYQPHDCKRTIGQCSYVEVENGEQRDFVRVTVPDAGSYHFVQFDGQGALLQRGYIQLDAFGTAGDGYAIDGSGNRTTYKLLGVTYPD